MNKIITATLWVALATALPDICKAQDTSTIDKLLTYTIAPLDKSQVTTQYLAEKGTIFWGMNTFNGTLTDDNVFVTNLWRMMYVQLQQSYVGSGTNSLPDIITVNNALQNNTLLNQPTPVPLLIGQYNSIDDNAANNGLLTYNSYTRQLNDVPNRPSSPYLTKNLFAACPTENKNITGVANIIVKSSLNYNNTGLGLSSVQIDFANGQGFVTIPLDVAVSAAYADTGYYRWTIKATLSNNTVLQCYADYYVVHIPPPTNNITTYSYNPGGVNGPTIPTWGIIAAIPNVHSGGTIHIVYSNKNRTNTLRKPLIVVENMDAYNLAPQVQARPFGIENFINALDEPRNQYDFNSQLDDVAGYDLVFINFNDGMDGIVRNAAVVQEAINRVNTNKVPDDRSGNIIQQNVVLGMGTGGLNARYALANMAKNFNGSNTRLLITHDAPHRGQNIAVGLQYLVKFINKSTAYSYNLGDVFPEHGQTLTYFKSKVCKDVLIYQTSENDNSVAVNSFIENMYQPMVTFANNTQPYQFIATSLGNECARPLFEAGRKFMDFGSQLASGVKLKATLSLFIGRSRRFEINLFSIPLSELKYQTVVFARSIPNQNDPARLITAFTYLSKLTLVGGLVNVSKNGVDEVAYASNNLLPIDGVPGSFHTLMDFTEIRKFQNSFGNFYFSYDDYITTLFKIPAKFFLAEFSLYGFFKSSMYNSEIFNTNYTSLPVGSALDVSPFNTNTFTQKYVNGTNQNYPSKSNNFIAQETVTSQSLYNNASMRFTARNARFLFNEMENLANTENCSNECSNPYLITGESIICSNGSYFIQGIPRGANVIWSASPSGIVSITANGPSASLTKISDGVITLTATISNACTVGNTSISKVVVIGTPVPEGIYGPNYDLCYNGRASESEYFSVPNSTNLLTYFWQINGVGSDIGPGILVNPFRWGIGMHEIKVRSYSATCGYSAWYISSFNVIDCNNFRMFSASPNPTTGDVQIENTSTDKSSVIKEIQVTDKYGNLKRQFKVFGSPKKYNISIRELPADVYIIRIYDGKTWISRKVFKN
ncbi:MAG: hypothetical protein CUR34_00205 [Sediminibacterium sp.]|nr:MAG: hypothetical protein CUR34_00205 [Sediminibacterium sp.] [Sediminibacterium sp. FEMGT703S]